MDISKAMQEVVKANMNYEKTISIEIVNEIKDSYQSAILNKEDALFYKRYMKMWLALKMTIEDDLIMFKNDGFKDNLQIATAYFETMGIIETDIKNNSRNY